MLAIVSQRKRGYNGKVNKARGEKKVDEKIMEKDWKFSINYLNALDGIRAFAILIVAWYHIWQLSWLQPIKNTTLLSVFHVNSINFDWMVRTGYQMVDVMLLLSGFCLFLPYAKSMVFGSKEPNGKTFYKKRVARIVPTYYICLLIVFIVAVTEKQYASNGDMWEDLVSHLFFVHNYTKKGYIYTKLNGVLWTLAIEVQFYLIFPLVAKVFKKKPVHTYFVMVALSWIFDNWVIIDKVAPENYSMWINQLPTFFSVYANGMMAAIIFVRLAHIFNRYIEQEGEKQAKSNRYMIGYFFTGIMIFSMYSYYKMMKDLTTSPRPVLWQINNRYEFTLVFAIFIIACMFAVPFVQKVLGNKVMRFFSGISFQIYVWHQFIAAQLKKHHIPAWTGEQEPNLAGDKKWMWNYFILCWVVVILNATLVTYCIERPCTKWIMVLGRKEEKGER